MELKRIHHVAYRCNGAKETVDFYRDVLGMRFQLAFAENEVPSTGAPDPYMHVFLDAGMGNVLAFFELPNAPPMGKDPNTPAWVQHIAFELGSRAELDAAKDRLEAAGLDVLGPVDHGIFDSIYFFDPNGHRLELRATRAAPKTAPGPARSPTPCSRSGTARAGRRDTPHGCTRRKRRLDERTRAAPRALRSPYFALRTSHFPLRTTSHHFPRRGTCPD